MSDLSDSLRYHDTDHLRDMVGMDATLVSTLGKAADRLDALEAENKALRKKLYTAYGIGIDDGMEMADHPIGLGGKTLHQVLQALEKT